MTAKYSYGVQLPRVSNKRISNVGDPKELALLGVLLGTYKIRSYSIDQMETKFGTREEYRNAR